MGLMVGDQLENMLEDKQVFKSKAGMVTTGDGGPGSRDNYVLKHFY